MTEGDEQQPQSQYEKTLIREAEALFVFREITLGVMHQVSNHLTALGSNLLMLEILCEKERVSRELRDLIEESKKMSRLAMQLLHSAQKRGAQLPPSLQRCWIVDELVRPAINSVSDTARASGITIRHSLTKHEYEVLLDGDLFKEALVSILNNAMWSIKANKKNTKKELFISVREEAEAQVLKIQITDSGIGINYENLRRLFTPFFTTRPEGTGLGLFFAKRIIEDANGSIGILRTAVNKGTTVEIRLPFGATSRR